MDSIRFVSECHFLFRIFCILFVTFALIVAENPSFDTYIESFLIHIYIERERDGIRERKWERDGHSIVNPWPCVKDVHLGAQLQLRAGFNVLANGSPASCHRI